MGAQLPLPLRGEGSVELSWAEATGAVGDSATVVPVVAAVAVLTDLGLAAMLV